jgi:hypothetical protein
MCQVYLHTYLCWYSLQKEVNNDKLIPKRELIVYGKVLMYFAEKELRWANLKSGQRPGVRETGAAIWY